MLRENGTGFHCFACNADGDILDLYQLRDHTDKATALKDLERKYNIKANPDYKPTGGAAAPQKAQKKENPRSEKPSEPPKDDGSIERYIETALQNISDPAALAYLHGRGLTDKTIADFKLGYDPQKKAVVIPYPGKVYYITRSLEGKEYRKPPKTADQLFIAGDPAASEVFLCEGQIDALSLIQSGVKCAAATGGAGKNVLSDLKQKTVYIIPDNDPKGEEHAAGVRETLNDELMERTVTLLRLPDQYKDVNEMLLSDPEGLEQLIAAPQKAASEDYRNEHSALQVSRSFFEAEEVNTPPIKIGFERLQEVLGGGLFPGLYVLGAVSSLGKTTFVLQVAESIAETGRNVLFFSLEMSKYELVAKSYSRLSYELAENKRNAKTTRGILNPINVLRYNPEEKQLIKEIVPAAYEKYAGNFFINEGLGTVGVKEIRDAIRKHIQMTGETQPVVFIDYLQILRPAEPHMTDKQTVDYNVVELKKISREYNIPVFVISSFNRENYSNDVNMAAFKESGSIEYTADVVLALKPRELGKETGKKADGKKKTPADTIEEYKAKDTREAALKILKNRNGSTNKEISFTYYALFNRFAEWSEDLEQYAAPKEDWMKLSEEEPEPEIYEYTPATEEPEQMSLFDLDI